LCGSWKSRDSCLRPFTSLLKPSVFSIIASNSVLAGLTLSWLSASERRCPNIDRVG
jgi:hypothetical protein